MKKLSNNKVELKKNVAYKKAYKIFIRQLAAIFFPKFH